MTREFKEAIATDHLQKRLKQRTGLSKKIASKIAQKALDNGITHAETKGKLKKYIDGLYLSHRSANNIRIYHREVYLFRNEVAITVINLPHRYIAAADKLKKIRKNKQLKIIKIKIKTYYI